MRVIVCNHAKQRFRMRGGVCVTVELREEKSKEAI